MVLRTNRLILRHWKESDADDLYKYASDPDVGPSCGWPPHRDIAESLNIIKNVLIGKESYAVCLQEDDKAIGDIKLKLKHSDIVKGDDECEVGCWIGKPFWGQGLMSEALEEVMRHAFEDIGMNKIWACYYAGNDRSKHLQEKAGFKYQRSNKEADVPLMHEKRTECVNAITKEEWLVKRSSTA